MDKVKHGRPEGSGSLVSGIGEYEPGRMSLKLGAKRTYSQTRRSLYFVVSTWEWGEAWERLRLKKKIVPQKKENSAQRFVI